VPEIDTAGPSRDDGEPMFDAADPIEPQSLGQCLLMDAESHPPRRRGCAIVRSSLPNGVRERSDCPLPDVKTARTTRASFAVSKGLPSDREDPLALGECHLWNTESLSARTREMHRARGRIDALPERLPR
jgi:hypothetical protein